MDKIDRIQVYEECLLNDLKRILFLMRELLSNLEFEHQSLLNNDLISFKRLLIRRSTLTSILQSHRQNIVYCIQAILHLSLQSTYQVLKQNTWDSLIALVKIEHSSFAFLKEELFRLSEELENKIRQTSCLLQAKDFNRFSSSARH